MFWDEIKVERFMNNHYNITWIDTVKAVCMICVYLIHSQVYYGLGVADFGWMLIPFYVTAFFFVSGYLFFRKYLNTNELRGSSLYYIGL